MIRPTKNLYMEPIALNEENSKEIITKISNDLDDLEPKIFYTINLLKKTMNSFYIEIDVNDKEFLLSPYFEQYLVDLQNKYLWPKQVYDVIFMYKKELA